MLSKLKLSVLIVALVAHEVCLCQENAKLQATKQASNQTCGSSDDLAKQVEVCAKPLIDLLEGTIERWPRTEKDAEGLCESFAWSERCIRDNARRCAKGLQKTIVSTLANSIQRTRKRECPAAKYPTVLKTTLCIEKHQSTMNGFITNAKSRIVVIEKQITDLDRKTNALCCMLHDMENNIRVDLTPFCPEETPQIIKLYRGLLEDVLELICRAPKCQDPFRGYKIPKITNSRGGLISGVLKVMFALG